MRYRRGFGVKAPFFPPRCFSLAFSFAAGRGRDSSEAPRSLATTQQAFLTPLVPAQTQPRRLPKAPRPPAAAARARQNAS